MRGKWWLAGSLAATAVVGAWMERAHQPRVVPLELAFTTARATPILATWDLARGMTYLRRDYAFLAVYWLPFTVAARSARAGRAVAALPVAAAACDAVENAFLLRLVDEARHGGVETAWLAPAAGTAATAKFLLLAATAAGVVRAARRRYRASTTAS